MDAQSDPPGCTTLWEPVRVQRGGNTNVRLEMVGTSRHDFGQPRSEPIAKAGEVFDRIAFRMIAEAL